jgi:hypothetical protein
MAIQYARVCGACERECPSWAHRCPVCGSTAIAHRMVITSAPPPAVANAQPARARRSRARVANHDVSQVRSSA